MYTHTGRKQLHANDNPRYVDPILNRNRKTHALNKGASSPYGDLMYQSLCGETLVVQEESGWTASVSTGEKITCKRCLRVLSKSSTAK